MNKTNWEKDLAWTVQQDIRDDTGLDKTRELIHKVEKDKDKEWLAFIERQEELGSIAEGFSDALKRHYNYYNNSEFKFNKTNEPK